MRPHFEILPCDTETPVSLFKKIASEQPYAFLFESAEKNSGSGRYSFIGFDPLEIHTFEAAADQNPFIVLAQRYPALRYTPCPELPPFQAGFVGYFCYEALRHTEKINIPLLPAEIPEAIFFLPKNLIAFDHLGHTITLISYSADDLKALRKLVLKGLGSSLGETTDRARSSVRVRPEVTAGRAKELSAQNKKFLRIAAASQEKIRAGEIFQIVLSQRVKTRTEESPFSIYRKLRSISPAPYLFYFSFPEFSIIGSSPETLVKVQKEKIFLRPIAGTRRRGKTPREDERLAAELKNDPKEQAEHMMLVDLGRNDLGRVAKVGSVEVTRCMELQKYSHVMHLVSEIRARKQSNASLFDIFQACFPAGTLTGAPKIRAIELIAKYEAMPRGIYGGAVGYFDLSGNMDFAIAIRTILYKNKIAVVQTGAGIVFDSIPSQENFECLNKAKAPLAALTI